MTVSELLSRVDSRELSEWMGREQFRPPSPEETRHAQLMHWLGCLWTKKPPAFDSFLPKRKKPAQTPGEIRSRLGTLGRV